MPTFIDESGETGAVSPAFRLAAVWLPTQDAVEAYRAGIQSFQQSIGLQGYEYKWSKTHSGQRTSDYLMEAMKHPFRFAVVSVNKVDRDWREAGTSVIHWACAVSLSTILRPVYLEEEARRIQESGEKQPLNELVVLDDNRDGRFLKVVKERFRALRSELRPGSPLVKKVKFRGSGPEELIQLADLVCGSVGAFLDGDPTCFHVISGRAIEVMQIP